MGASTQLSNKTKHVIKVLVGSGRYVSELATVKAGGNYVLAVDFNATYLEYTVRVDAPGTANFVVSSDDLCDNKSITIKEEDAQLQVQMEPRQSRSSAQAATEAPIKSEKKHSWLRAWMSK